MHKYRQLLLENLVLYLIKNTHNGSNKYGSISFMIDNMHYVNFRILEQDSVPRCGEIQNKRLEILGNSLIFTLIPLYA